MEARASSSSDKSEHSAIIQVRPFVRGREKKVAGRRRDREPGGPALSTTRRAVLPESSPQPCSPAVLYPGPRASYNKAPVVVVSAPVPPNLQSSRPASPPFYQSWPDPARDPDYATSRNFAQSLVPLTLHDFAVVVQRRQKLKDNWSRFLKSQKLESMKPNVYFSWSINYSFFYCIFYINQLTVALRFESAHLSNLGTHALKFFIFFNFFCFIVLASKYSKHLEI